MMRIEEAITDKCLIKGIFMGKSPETVTYNIGESIFKNAIVENIVSVKFYGG
jgi:hypothetical protein